MSTIDLEKLAKKRQYKLRGVFLRLEWVNNSIARIFVSKGQGKDKKIFIFTVLNPLSHKFAALKPNYRVKLWFTIKCNEFNSKWFTELIVQDFEHWQVNADKIQKQAYQQQLIDDNLYQKSLYKLTD